jgi:hypothetical protein
LAINACHRETLLLTVGPGPLIRALASILWIIVYWGTCSCSSERCLILTRP